MPPGTACFSASSTRLLASAAWIALNAPANPKPMTMTSNVSSKSGIPRSGEPFRAIVRRAVAGDNSGEQEGRGIDDRDADGPFARDRDDRVEQRLGLLDQFRAVGRIVDAPLKIAIGRSDIRIGNIDPLRQGRPQPVLTLEHRIGLVEH